MIKHVVLFKFKSNVTDSDISKLEEGLGALPSIISEIKEYEFGRNVINSERSFDFGLVSGFDDLDALQRYSKHPHHLEVLKHIGEICDNIKSVDFYSTDKE
ncbi:MAG: Dabb family protein [Bacteroidetes bacterium]|nr:Dabb family protein [Bacteroidota bacterium]